MTQIEFNHNIVRLLDMVVDAIGEVDVSVGSVAWYKRREIYDETMRLTRLVDTIEN